MSNYTSIILQDHKLEFQPKFETFDFHVSKDSLTRYPPGSDKDPIHSIHKLSSNILV